LDDLIQELALISSNVFGLSHAIVDCNDQTTLDDFTNAILTDPSSSSRAESPVRLRQDSYFLHSPAFRSISRSPRSESFADTRKICEVVIVKNLDEAPKQVQIQALELIKTKRIYTRTSVQSAPKRFLFVAVVAGGEGPRLTKHLNDHMFISHFHAPEDGFPNLEELESDKDSISSVVRKTSIGGSPSSDPVVSALEIEVLESNMTDITLTPEISQYVQNIITFLRMHRAVRSGVSPSATKHFDKLARSLAPLHGLKYVTPSLVALAAKKIYPHRIHIVDPQNERSMQWGSDIEAVTAALQGVGPDQVIEDVLSSVEVPL